MYVKGFTSYSLRWSHETVSFPDSRGYGEGEAHYMNHVVQMNYRCHLN